MEEVSAVVEGRTGNSGNLEREVKSEWSLFCRSVPYMLIKSIYLDFQQALACSTFEMYFFNGKLLSYLLGMESQLLNE